MSNANELAFPLVVTNLNGDSQVSAGLTKREYIAAKCMAGILPTCTADDATVDKVIAVVATYSVKAADALLAELAKS